MNSLDSSVPIFIGQQQKTHAEISSEKHISPSLTKPNEKMKWNEIE